MGEEATVHEGASLDGTGETDEDEEAGRPEEATATATFDDFDPPSPTGDPGTLGWADEGRECGWERPAQGITASSSRAGAVNHPSFLLDEPTRVTY